MDRLVDAACSDLRRFAAERRADWVGAASAPEEGEDAVLREQWRFWREQTLLDDVAEEPVDGHGILLRSLLSDLHAGYQALRPQFTLGVTSAGASSALERLRMLIRAAHLETRRFLMQPLSATPERMESDVWPGPELQRLAIAFKGLGFTSVESGPHCAGQVGIGLDDVSRWDMWYLKMEERLEHELPAKVRALHLRRQRAAGTLKRVLGELSLRRSSVRAAQQTRAAVVLQRVYRGRMRPRCQRLQEKLRRAREYFLIWRLRRRLCRYVMRRRYSRIVGDGAFVLATVDACNRTSALRIQAFCRGRWCRKGWAYCWAPPFCRPQTQRERATEKRADLPVLTGAMGRAFAALRKRRRERSSEEEQRRCWQWSLAGERLLIRAWLREQESQQQRSGREAILCRRFEVQWAKYAEGLEAYVRTKQNASGEDWVSTVDAGGQAVWLSRKTGRTRKSDPVEVRVQENLKRERRKAEQRFSESLEQLRQAWAEEDAECEVSHLAGLEELALSRGAWAAAASALGTQERVV